MLLIPVTLKNLVVVLWIAPFLAGCMAAPDIAPSAEAVLMEWRGQGPFRLSRSEREDGLFDDVYRFAGTLPHDGQQHIVEYRERTYKGLIALSGQIRSETVDKQHQRKTVEWTFHEIRIDRRDLEKLYQEMIGGASPTFELTFYSWEESADCALVAATCERPGGEFRDYKKQVSRHVRTETWRVQGEEIVTTNDGAVPVVVLEDEVMGRMWYSPRRKMLVKHSHYYGTTEESIFKVPFGDPGGGMFTRDRKPL